MDDTMIARWCSGAIATSVLIESLETDLRLKLSPLAKRLAVEDSFKLLREMLDQERDARTPLSTTEEICRVGEEIYGHEPTNLKSRKPFREESFPVTQERRVMAAYQRSVSEYLEDEDIVKPSPLLNYIAGFQTDVSPTTRITLTKESGSTGIFASLPDDQTPGERRNARLLSLRLFAGWSLAEIAAHDHLAEVDVRLMWEEARKWAKAQAKPDVVDVAFDDLDRQVVRLLAATPELIHALEWRTFERILAATLDKIGYEVELQRGTKDGGIDVIAIKGDRVFGRHRYVIQAKRWRGRVGVAPVRELLFLRQQIGATKACLATTSSFTAGARRLAREHWWELELRDFDALREWLAEAANK